MRVPAPAPEHRILVRPTVRAAWALVREHPRESVLPSLLIEVPVTLIIAVVTAVMFLTVFGDNQFKLATDLDGDDTQGVVFLLLLGAGVQALFAQVAHGATIAGVASVLRGKPGGATAALDAAFARMGALLLMAVILVIFGTLLLVSLVGIVLVPLLLIRLSMSYEALMVNNLRVTQAFARSWRLTSGHVLRILGTLLFGGLTALPAFFFAFFLNAAVVGSRTQEIVLATVVAMAVALILAPVYAFFTALTTIIYFKLLLQTPGE